ncbi:ubiquitin carrier protein [Aphelenchoides avenae]|nr:ubiquitin carrier protein [Aphelenchus avenae]
MSNIAQVRMQRECREIATSPELQQNGIFIEPSENMSLLTGRISGPTGGPYEGGSFQLKINLPSEYPFKPPTVHFLTPIWHPNVSSQTGFVCLDILKDQWAASLTLRTILLSVQALMSAPETSDPQDAVVASQYTNKRPLFEVGLPQNACPIALFKATAKFWAQEYAGAPGEKDLDKCSKISKIIAMGVDRVTAVQKLSNWGWDVSKATEEIFS